MRQHLLMALFMDNSMDITFYTPIVTTPIHRDHSEPWLTKRSDKSLLVETVAVRVVDDVTQFDEVIVIPKGYVFDWSSIPRIVWFLFPPNYSQSRYASLVHDYLYSHLHHHFTKEFADRLFKAIMEHFNAPQPIVFAFYHSVRLFGRGGWMRRQKQNAHSHWSYVYEKLDYRLTDQTALWSIVKPFLDQELEFITRPERNPPNGTTV